jgi:glycosyltransferase involved in cell wall biosynthesis
MPRLYLDLRIFGMQPFGGISTQWADLLKRIDPQFDDFTVTLLLPRTNSNVVIQSLSLDRFDVREVSPKGAYRKYAPNSFRGERDDILHPSYYAWYPFFRGKRVITVHDFNYDFHTNPVIRHAHRHLMHDSITHADVIFCVSSTTQRELVKRYPRLDSKQVYVTPNSTDLLNRATIASPKDYLIWVGGREHTKRFDDALRFMKVLSGIPDCGTKLIITGRPLKKDEEIEIARAGLSDRILSRPCASQTDLLELYGNAIALLYLSEFEGFGIPIVEAQACGCPVVARPSDTSTEVGKDSLIYINDITTSSVYEVWSKLTNQAARQTITAVGRENCARYSWDDTVQTMMQAYRSAAVTS